MLSWRASSMGINGENLQPGLGSTASSMEDLVTATMEIEENTCLGEKAKNAKGNLREEVCFASTNTIKNESKFLPEDDPMYKYSEKIKNDFASVESKNVKPNITGIGIKGETKVLDDDSLDEEFCHPLAVIDYQNGYLVDSVNNTHFGVIEQHHDFRKITLISPTDEEEVRNWDIEFFSEGSDCDDSSKQLDNFQDLQTFRSISQTSLTSFKRELEEQDTDIATNLSTKFPQTSLTETEEKRQNCDNYNSGNHEEGFSRPFENSAKSQCNAVPQNKMLRHLLETISPEKKVEKQIRNSGDHHEGFMRQFDNIQESQRFRSADQTKSVENLPQTGSTEKEAERQNHEIRSSVIHSEGLSSLNNSQESQRFKSISPLNAVENLPRTSSAEKEAERQNLEFRSSVIHNESYIRPFDNSQESQNFNSIPQADFIAHLPEISITKKKLVKQNCEISSSVNHDKCSTRPFDNRQETQVPRTDTILNMPETRVTEKEAERQNNEIRRSVNYNEGSRRPCDNSQQSQRLRSISHKPHLIPKRPQTSSTQKEVEQQMRSSVNQNEGFILCDNSQERFRSIPHQTHLMSNPPQTSLRQKEAERQIGSSVHQNEGFIRPCDYSRGSQCLRSVPQNHFLPNFPQTSFTHKEAERQIGSSVNQNEGFIRPCDYSQESQHFRSSSYQTHLVSNLPQTSLRQKEGERQMRSSVNQNEGFIRPCAYSPESQNFRSAPHQSHSIPNHTQTSLTPKEAERQMRSSVNQNEGIIRPCDNSREFQHFRSAPHQTHWIPNLSPTSSTQKEGERQMRSSVNQNEGFTRPCDISQESQHFRSAPPQTHWIPNLPPTSLTQQEAEKQNHEIRSSRNYNESLSQEALANEFDYFLKSHGITSPEINLYRNSPQANSVSTMKKGVKRPNRDVGNLENHNKSSPKQPKIRPKVQQPKFTPPTNFIRHPLYSNFTYLPFMEHQYPLNQYTNVPNSELQYHWHSNLPNTNFQYPQHNMPQYPLQNVPNNELQNAKGSKTVDKELSMQNFKTPSTGNNHGNFSWQPHNGQGFQPYRGIPKNNPIENFPQPNAIGNYPQPYPMNIAQAQVHKRNFEIWQMRNYYKGKLKQLVYVDVDGRSRIMPQTVENPPQAMENLLQANPFNVTGKEAGKQNCEVPSWNPYDDFHRQPDHFQEYQHLNGMPQVNSIANPPQTNPRNVPGKKMKGQKNEVVNQGNQNEGSRVDGIQEFQRPSKTLQSHLLNNHRQQTNPINANEIQQPRSKPGANSNYNFPQTNQWMNPQMINMQNFQCQRSVPSNIRIKGFRSPTNISHNWNNMQEFQHPSNTAAQSHLITNPPQTNPIIGQKIQRSKSMPQANLITCPPPYPIDATEMEIDRPKKEHLGSMTLINAVENLPQMNPITMTPKEAERQNKENHNLRNSGEGFSKQLDSSENSQCSKNVPQSSSAGVTKGKAVEKQKTGRLMEALIEESFVQENEKENLGGTKLAETKNKLNLKKRSIEEPVCCLALFKESGAPAPHSPAKDNLEVLICLACQKKFSSQPELMDHMMQEHLKIQGKLSYRCRKCEAHFQDSRSLASHLKWGHSNEFYYTAMCLDCHSKLEMDERLKELLTEVRKELNRSENTRNNSPDRGPHSFRQKGAENKKHSVSQSIVCSKDSEQDDDTSSVDSFSLVIDEDQNEDNESGKQVQAQADSSTNSPETNIIDLTADEIEKDSKVNLSVNTLSIDSLLLPNEKETVCKNNETKQLTRNSLVFFDGSITKKTTFACRHCPAEFTQDDFFKKHEMTHCEKSTYHCPYCPKHYKFETRLATHLQIHENEPSYKCKYCREQFLRCCDLMKHLKTVHSNGYWLHGGRSLVEFHRNSSPEHHPVEALQKKRQTRAKRKKTSANLVSDALFPKADVLIESVRHLPKKIASESPADTSKNLCELCGEQFLERSVLKKHVELVHSDKFRDAEVIQSGDERRSPIQNQTCIASVCVSISDTSEQNLKNIHKSCLPSGKGNASELQSHEQGKVAEGPDSRSTSNSINRCVLLFCVTTSVPDTSGQKLGSCNKSYLPSEIGNAPEPPQNGEQDQTKAVGPSSSSTSNLTVTCIAPFCVPESDTSELKVRNINESCLPSDEENASELQQNHEGQATAPDPKSRSALDSTDTCVAPFRNPGSVSDTSEQKHTKFNKPCLPSGEGNASQLQQNHEDQAMAPDPNSRSTLDSTETCVAPFRNPGSVSDTSDQKLGSFDESCLPSDKGNVPEPPPTLEQDIAVAAGLNSRSTSNLTKTRVAPFCNPGSVSDTPEENLGNFNESCLPSGEGNAPELQKNPKKDIAVAAGPSSRSTSNLTKKLYCCRFCDNVFSVFELYQKHRLKAHPNESCSPPSSKQNASERGQNHCQDDVVAAGLSSESPPRLTKRLYVCRVCNAGFCAPRFYKKHLLRFHPNESFPALKIRNVSKLEQHHVARGRNFRPTSTKPQPQIKHSTLKCYNCQFCAKLFCTLQFYKKHLMNDHPKKLQLFSSEEQMATLISNSTMDVDFTSIFDGEKYRCQYCHRRCSYLSGLKKHLVYRHPDKLSSRFGKNSSSGVQNDAKGKPVTQDDHKFASLVKVKPDKVHHPPGESSSSGIKQK